MVFGALLSNGRQRVGAFKKLAFRKMPLNIRIQWNVGTACVSECVLKTSLACRGLRVGPSKLRAHAHTLSGKAFTFFLLRTLQNNYPAHLVTACCALLRDHTLIDAPALLRDYALIDAPPPLRAMGFLNVSTWHKSGAILLALACAHTR